MSASEATETHKETRAFREDAVGCLEPPSLRHRLVRETISRTRGGGGGLCVAIALRDPGLGSESPLGSFPLESPTGALSSSEPEVPLRMQEGGANNNSRSVLRLLVRYLHWPIPSYNSPLRSVQVLIYQIRKLRSYS